MRRYLWSRMAVGLLLVATVACAAPGPVEEESVTTAVPPATAETLTPEATATVEPLRAAVPTRTHTPQPTFTPESLAAQPGWRGFGDERIGLRLAAPESWVETLRLPEAIDLKLRLGRHSLLLTDTAETARNLLNGTAVESGLFVLAFISPLVSRNEPGLAPDELLAELLAGWMETADEPPPIVAIESLQLPAAYTELDFIPFALFPDNEDALRLRLTLIHSEELDAPVVTLLGSSAAEWENYEAIFTGILREIRLYATDITPIAGELMSGDSVNGRLEPGGVGLWAFRGESGRYATISLMPGSANMDLTLTLIDPSGRTVETVDNGYAGDNELLADALLSETGLYFIEAREFFAEPGPYRLLLTLTNAPQFGGGGRIALGEELQRDLPPRGEHVWTFDATAGQIVSIVLTPLNPQLDLILELSGPDGRPIISRDEGFSGDPELIVGQILAVSGEYTILVRGFAGSGGPYRLSLDEGGESTLNFWEAGDIAYQEVRREALRDNEAHAWYFQGEAGDEATILVRPLDSRLDLEIWLLDPDVNELVIKDDYLLGEPETIVYVLPVSGQYIILVRDFFGQSGAYELSLTVSGLSQIEPMGRLPFNERKLGVLSEGKRASWTFDGRTNDRITIHLNPLTAASDLVITLQNPAGESAAIVDASLAGSPETLSNFTLTADGVWTVIVHEFFDSGGRYELLLTRN